MESLEAALATLGRASALLLEVLGVIAVLAGTVKVVVGVLRGVVGGTLPRFTALRLDLARFLALGLEFQLAADIVETAITPSWEQIGRLGAIAVIRTALNYFLAAEMREGRKMLADEAVVEAPVAKHHAGGGSRNVTPQSAR